MTITGRSNWLARRVSSSAPKSSPHWIGLPGLVEDLDRLGVGDPRERRQHRFELRGVALEDLQVLRAALEHPADEVADELLGELAEPFELEEGDLGLDHPELHQVAAGLRLLGPEGRAEAVDLAERRGRRLEVELAGLREVGLVAEVVGLEQRRGALAGRRGEDRRVDQREVALVEEVADRLLDLAAHPQRRPLAARAQPEVAVLHQERGAVLLGGDRVVLGQVRGPRSR